MQINEALFLLDPKEDSQWTQDGLPLVEKVRELMGDETVTRAMISDACPDFNREKAATFRDESEEEETDTNKPAFEAGKIEEGIDPIQELDQKINSLMDEKAGIENQITALSRKRDFLAERQIVVRTQKDDTAERMAYIRNQNKLRTSRGVQTRQLQEALKGTQFEISGKSPIDQSFRRKTGFGATRPTYPTQTVDNNEAGK
jgi:hypothetical protein